MNLNYTNFKIKTSSSVRGDFEYKCPKNCDKEKNVPWISVFGVSAGLSVVLIVLLIGYLFFSKIQYEKMEKKHIQ
jgi:hypothetical protein